MLVLNKTEMLWVTEFSHFLFSGQRWPFCRESLLTDTERRTGGAPGPAVTVGEVPAQQSEALLARVSQDWPSVLPHNPTHSVLRLGQLWGVALTDGCKQRRGLTRRCHMSGWDNKHYILLRPSGQICHLTKQEVPPLSCLSPAHTGKGPDQVPRLHFRVCWPTKTRPPEQENRPTIISPDLEPSANPCPMSGSSHSPERIEISSNSLFWDHNVSDIYQPEWCGGGSERELGPSVSTSSHNLTGSLRLRTPLNTVALGSCLGCHMWLCDRPPPSWHDSYHTLGLDTLFDPHHDNNKYVSHCNLSRVKCEGEHLVMTTKLSNWDSWSRELNCTLI